MKPLKNAECKHNLLFLKKSIRNIEFSMPVGTNEVDSEGSLVKKTPEVAIVILPFSIKSKLL